MKSTRADKTGLTRDAGWQIGLRRTLPIPAPVLWKWMLSTEGVEVWLGKGSDFRLEPGMKYQLEDGTVGEVRVYQPGSHWRMTRLPPGGIYSRGSVMQIRILDAGEKSTLVFHEEHLPSEDERSRRKDFYLEVVSQIKRLLLPD